MDSDEEQEEDDSVNSSIILETAKILAADDGASALSKNFLKNVQSNRDNHYALSNDPT